MKQQFAALFVLISFFVIGACANGDGNFIIETVVAAGLILVDFIIAIKYLNGGKSND